MNLTDSAKKIGQENFCAAIAHPALRREFLKKQVDQSLASGRGLGPYYFGYGGKINQPLRVAILGTGDEGSVLIGALNPEFIEVKAIADVRPYSVYRAFHGDVYSAAARSARPGLMAKYGWKTEDEARKHVKVYGDYRALLAEAKSLDIEAVIIALPLHLHAPAAIAAMKAGLHVLTEKLMAHSVAQCKEMARMAKQTHLILAVGHQRHYNILYDHAVELIRRGVLGQLHYIRAQWHRANLPGRDSWKQPLPPGAKDLQKYPEENQLAEELAQWEQQYQKLQQELQRLQQTPNQTKQADAQRKRLEEFEKRLRQKRAQAADREILDKAAEFGYQAHIVRDAEGRVVYEAPPIEELIRWRLWDRTGGGLMAELGSHQLDAASIFIAAVHGGQKQLPLCVMAAGNRPLFPPDRDIEDHVYCMIEFPAPGYDPKDDHARRKKITFAYASINGNGFGGYGETVFGTQGTLALETEKEAMLWKSHWVEDHIRLLAGKGKESLQLEMVEQADQWDRDAAALGTLATSAAVRGYTEEIEHWAWCIRNPAPENQPRCHAKVALADAVIALTTNLAARRAEKGNDPLAGRIEFLPEWFDPDRDETPDGEKPDLSRYS